MRGVETDLGPVAVPARMEVAAERALEPGREVEFSQINALEIRQTNQHQGLHAVFVGVGVVENPLSIRRVGAVTIACQDLFADDRGFFGFGVEQIEVVAFLWCAAPGQDGVVIFPVEMGNQARVDDQAEVAAVGVDGEQARVPVFARFPPAMQE